MPSIKRKTPRYRVDLTELNIDQTYQLETGSIMFSFGEPMDLETFTTAWEMHGERLLPKFIAENPGRRPFAWWLLDHGKERPVVNDWFDEKRMREQESRGRGLDVDHCPFGYLHTRCYGGPGFGPFQEEEHDYLERHGLLEPGERERMQQTFDEWRKTLKGGGSRVSGPRTDSKEKQ